MDMTGAIITAISFLIILVMLGIGAYSLVMQRKAVGVAVRYDEELELQKQILRAMGDLCAQQQETNRLLAQIVEGNKKTI